MKENQIFRGVGEHLYIYNGEYKKKKKLLQELKTNHFIYHSIFNNKKKLNIRFRIYGLF